jgi:hypothetical protein
VTQEQDRREAFVRASQRRIWRITAVAAAAILGLGFGTAAVLQSNADRAREQRRDAGLQRAQAQLLERQREDIACVKRWADQYTNRADRINELQQPKSDALDRLLASVPARDRALFEARLQAYLDASAKARRNAQQNPLPPSPVFACGLDPSSAPRPFTPGPSSPPSVPPASSSSARPSPTARPAASPSSRRAVRLTPSSSAVVSRTVRPASSPSRTVAAGRPPSPTSSPTRPPRGPRPVALPICTLPAVPPFIPPLALC